MPTKMVNLSARSEMLSKEPFQIHLWECMPNEYLEFLCEPQTFLRIFLSNIGITLADSCHIESTIENHDWIDGHAKGLQNANGTVICNTRAGSLERSVYRVVSYGHDNPII